ncbi:MAG: enoyl-CoA hydratase/isomerase family protein, partial [Elusimicrobiota bacterium]
MPLVSWRTDGSVSTLALERPEALNAMSEEMAKEFSTAVRRLAKEKSKVVVLMGRGPAFCAGGDLAFIEENRRRPSGTLAPLMRRFYGAFLSIRDLPQVTIAKVHGPAVGAGLCLAMACDLRVVCDDARLGFVLAHLASEAAEAVGSEIVEVGRFAGVFVRAVARASNRFATLAQA